MWDYLVAIVAGFVGLAILLLVFRSISNAPDVVITNTATVRQSRAKRTARQPRRNQDDMLDKEMEELIAREIRGISSGMSADTKKAQVVSLEDYNRSKKREPAETRRVVPMEAAIERQGAIDRELGFTTVNRASPPKSKKEPNQPSQVASNEELDRKLGQFFRNNKRSKKPQGGNRDEPESGSSPTGGPGGRVVMKKDISNTRSW